MSLEFYADDDTTLVSDLAFTGVEAGTDSDVLTLHLWNSINNPAGQAAQNVILIQQTEDPTVPDRFLASGVPPQDQQWGRARIVGFDNTGDPTWSVPNTDWTPLGAWSSLPIGTIPPDCAVYIERRLHPPSTATGLLTWRILDAVLKDEYARPLPAPFTLVERGVLPLTGDRATSVVLRGCEVTASGPADDEIHVAAGMWQYKGRVAGKIATDHTLDQNDSAAAALASGQSYYATISLDDAGVVVTKGVKATSPVKPGTPAGNAFLAWALVQYDAGGSAVETADLTGTPAYGRFLVTDGGALTAKIHKGQAVAGAAYRIWTVATTVNLTDAADNTIWQISSGLYEVNTTGEPPELGALEIAVVTCAGGIVTAIEDRRLYAGRSVMLALSGPTPAAAAMLDDLMVEHPDLDIEEVAFRISDMAGTAGATQVDLKKNGTTIFSSFATEDQRPSIAFDEPILQIRTAIPEVTRLQRGDVLSAWMVAVPTTASPAKCEVVVTCRIP